MVSGDDIPTELWDEVLGFLLTEKDPQTLQRLNLINRRFHHLARPRLFADFTFYPFYLVKDSFGWAPDFVLPLYFECFRRSGQRLEFWASEDIAPLVRNCTVQPLESWEAEPHHDPPTEDPYSLLKLFYEFLPRFVNLEFFAASTLQFTSIATANLCLLTKLRALSIDSCTAVEGEALYAPSKLKLQTFRFANSDDLEEWWLRAICSDTLRNLALDLSEMGYQGFFRGLQPRVPCFPNVQALDIAVGRRSIASVHVNPLAKFPRVRDLALTKWHQYDTFGGITMDFSELGDTKYCPLLERYFGPVAVLPFLPVSTLTDITIEPCEPADFLIKMRAVEWKPTSLRYLRVSFMGYLTSLRDLTDIFADVTILRVAIAGRPRRSAVDNPQKAVSFLESLPSSLPEGLVKLAIDWKFEEPVQMALPDMKKLKDDILAQRPALKTLWIHCEHCAFVWSQMPDGKESSMVWDGLKFAAKILPQFDLFFYGFWSSRVNIVDHPSDSAW